MSDDKNTVRDDLYGDLDLEDLDDNLDASQLEELVDVPDSDHSQYQAPAAPQAGPSGQYQAQDATPAPAQPQYGQQQPPASSLQGQAGPQGAQDQDGENGLDRIKPSDMPDEGKMFIGGLNWETNDDNLKAYMEQFGEVDACTVMRDPTGRSRGFAFLTYKDPASVTRVLAQNHHLDGKQIDPKRAIPRAEHEKTAKVFVGGLAPTVTSESLKQFLSQFGGVMDATVMIDRETQRSKGFAFATFESEDAVNNAMQASGMELEGRHIEIRKAQPRGAGNQPNKFSTGRGQTGQATGNMNMGMGNMGMGMGFDPNAMAMMYQNMMKNTGMGMGMGGGFDPNAMAMMYQNMMKSMGGMGNAPAINPNMANMMRNNMGAGMGGMGMGNMMGMGGMGMMGNMMGMGGMGGMGSGGMGSPPPAGQGGFQNGAAMGQRNQPARPIPTAPRGPAAMRTGPAQAAPAAPAGQQGPGAQRYSTQGAARSKPY